MARLITTETTEEARARINRQALGYKLREDAKVLDRYDRRVTAVARRFVAKTLLYPQTPRGVAN